MASGDIHGTMVIKYVLSPEEFKTLVNILKMIGVEHLELFYMEEA